MTGLVADKLAYFAKTLRSPPCRGHQWPSIQVLVAILSLFALVQESFCLNMRTSDQQALQQMSQRWQGVLTTSNQPWTFSSDCFTTPFYGLTCIDGGAAGVYITQIVIDSGWGGEDTSVAFSGLGQNMPDLATLVIQGYNLSLDAQVALFAQSLRTLSIYDSPMPVMADTGNLPALNAFILSNAAELQILPALASSSSLSAIQLLELPTLASIQGPWPTVTTGLTLTIQTCPLLNDLPSFAPLSNLNTLNLVELPNLMNLLPDPPAYPCKLTQVTLRQLPALHSLPDFSGCPLANLALIGLTAMPLDALDTNLAAYTLTKVTIDDPDRTDFPTFMCVANASTLALIVHSGSYSSLPDCLCYTHLTTLSPFVVPTLTWVPLCLFTMPKLASFDLGLADGLIVNSTVTNFDWHLPSLIELTLPPHYVTHNVPNSHSTLGAATNPELTLTITGSPVNAAIPDQYFLIFPTLTGLFATSLGFQSPLPSSLLTLSKLQLLVLANNSFTGSFPVELLQLPSLSNINLGYNSFSGDMSNLTTANFSGNLLSIISFTNNTLDLCSIHPNYTFPFPAEESCMIGGYCTGCTPNWSLCTAQCRPLPPPISPPFGGIPLFQSPGAAPTPLLTPVSPPSSPSQQTPPSPLQPPSAIPALQPFVSAPSPVTAPVYSGPCGGPPPAVGDWDCSSNGEWVSNSSVLTTDPITIEAPVTVIEGNLSAPTIILTNFSNTLTVTGCIFNVSTVELTLNHNDIQHLVTSDPSRTKTLLAQNASVGCDPISAIPISLTLPSDACQQVSTSSSSNTNPSTLVAVFGVDSSGCKSPGSKSNTWWIILASVVGGVVLIVIVLVILILKVPALRSRLLPALDRRSMYKSNI